MEKIRLLNNTWKGYLKTWISKIGKASRGIAPGPHKGSHSAPYEPPFAMTNMLTHVEWIMAHNHKTQSLKNGGQQKCLDKDLANLRK